MSDALQAFTGEIPKDIRVLKQSEDQLVARRGRGGRVVKVEPRYFVLLPS